MKGINVKYNLDNDNWTDEEYENQEEREIFIPISIIRSYIEQADKVCGDNITRVDIISRIKEVY